jgi:CysZ protein
MHRGPVGLVLGATYPLRAFLVIARSPQLQGYILIPVLVNVILGIALYIGLLIPGFRGIDAAIANLPDWAAFLDWVLRILLAIGLFVSAGFLLLQFGVIFGSPWYGKLSEELEQLRTGRPLAETPSTVGGVFRDIWRALLFELKKLLLTVMIGLLLLLLNFLPGFGTAIAAIGGIALATTLVCLDFFDPALERRRLRFRTKLGMIARSLPASATFGLVCLGLISIPFLNLLAIPICVAAGTLFFCDRILPQSHLLTDTKLHSNK